METGKRRWLMLAVLIGAPMICAGGQEGLANAAPLARDGSPARSDVAAARLAAHRDARRWPAPLLAQDEPPPGVELAADPGVVYPTAPPPDAIPEYPPPAPGYGYVWINGYWDWTGYEWTWNSGFWAPRQSGARFYAPRFVFVNGAPVYYRGYWVDPYGRREYGYGWRGAPPPAWRARPSVAPTMWRAQHAEGWRRVPGAPTVWRAPARRDFPGARPGMEPRRVERGPAPGMAAPMSGRPVGAPTRPAGGMRGGEGRAPMGGMPHNAVAAPHPMTPPPRPAATPAPHAAPGMHRK